MITQSKLGYADVARANPECNIGIPTAKADCIPNELERLSEHVGYLHKLFGELESKLTPIRIIHPVCLQTEEKEYNDGSDIRGIIKDQINSLWVLRNRMESLYSDIDL